MNTKAENKGGRPSKRKLKTRSSSRGYEKSTAISKQQLVDLMDISLHVWSFARHEINNRLAVIHALAEIAKRLPDKQHLSAISKQAETTQRTLDAYFRLNRPPNRPGLFKSSPIDAVELVRNTFPQLAVEVDRSSSRRLQLLFPAPILFGIFSELSRNALAGREKGNICVSWGMTGSRFSCIIDDDGPGIAGLDGTVPQPLAVLSERVVLGEGLSIINATLYFCSGTLFFRKSRRLGGTEVTVAFTVTRLKN